jgi:hypothetical protein
MYVRQIRKFREELNFDVGMDYSYKDGQLHSPSASNITATHLNLHSCVAKRIWDLKEHLDFANEVFLQSTTDSAQTYRGYMQTTSAVKLVRLDGVGNNCPLAHIPALLHVGDDAYDIAKELGWKYYDELNKIARGMAWSFRMGQQ